MLLRNFSIFVLLALTSLVVNSEPLPMGAHTRVRMFTINEDIPAYDPNEIIPTDGTFPSYDIRKEDVVYYFPPLPNMSPMTVWDSYTICISYNYDKNTNITLSGWVKDMDTSDYYTNLVVNSQTGPQCATFTFPYPVHVQHNLRNTLRCINGDNVVRRCKAHGYLSGH